MYFETLRSRLIVIGLLVAASAAALFPRNQPVRKTVETKVGDSVVGKHLAPTAAVDTDVGPLDSPSRVFYVKAGAHALARYSRSAGGANGRRRVIDVHRVAQPLARHCSHERIIERIRSDDFENVATIRETRGIDRVERIADVLFQEPEVVLSQ